MNDPTVILADAGHLSRTLFAPGSQWCLCAGMGILVKAWTVPPWEL
jgi:hypothetical protein